ncbi:MULTISPECIES: MarR family winged helix-turn-helix transcriptional regulator [Gordonia]|uniref:MarR family transcriptional regulator n=1 Tax=Gordonia alkanivorans CGMCC 6845 TaxID=1423140 RepID=W9DKY1_9ACTN|nr:MULTISPECIES: MarR family transcriptional regulator [Gordonia]ETA07796.1 MarR family transcriptional regulator [Gordonia alkanivorans CGMCC 6845]MDH3013014.1 MarR family transcriptional regulator [Gordonia alkanivorans]MDH3050064.1 MarR family transcriptional regulator [Gordonia alkanivorans]MDJ0029296.1 MarR family transcriptional regulator [Gordonia alkanivorans]OLT45613.1 MarR family transcriptional regulator [Gordonia sp. CNJ-863]
MDVSHGAQFARMLVETFDAMTREVTEKLTEAGHAGLTVSNELAMEAIEEGAGNAASLARHLGVSRQAAAKTISTLEGLGYVERAADTDDARRKSLQITAHGREAIAIGSAAFEQIRVRWEAAVGAHRAAETEDGLRALRDDVAGN